MADSKITRKTILVVVLLLLAILVLTFIFTGFSKRTDVVLLGFTEKNEDEIEIKTTLAGSMGFIRDISTIKSGDRLYCSFYCTFGGLDSDLGAKDSFVITADKEINKIYFSRPEGKDILVFFRDSEGSWTENRKTTGDNQ